MGHNRIIIGNIGKTSWNISHESPFSSSVFDSLSSSLLIVAPRCPRQRRSSGFHQGGDCHQIAMGCHGFLETGKSNPMAIPHWSLYKVDFSKSGWCYKKHIRRHCEWRQCLSNSVTRLHRIPGSPGMAEQQVSACAQPFLCQLGSKSGHKASQPQRPFFGVGVVTRPIAKQLAQWFYWLVGQDHPSEKYESIGMIRSSQYFWENKIDGNQTTNQFYHFDSFGSAIAACCTDLTCEKSLP